MQKLVQQPLDKSQNAHSKWHFLPWRINKKTVGRRRRFWMKLWRRIFTSSQAERHPVCCRVPFEVVDIVAAEFIAINKTPRKVFVGSCRWLESESENFLYWWFPPSSFLQNPPQWHIPLNYQYNPPHKSGAQKPWCDNKPGIPWVFLDLGVALLVKIRLHHFTWNRRRRPSVFLLIFYVKKCHFERAFWGLSILSSWSV